MANDLCVTNGRQTDAMLDEAQEDGVDERSSAVISTLWTTSILPSLEENARSHAMNVAEHASQRRLAGKLTKALFDALHSQGEGHAKRGPARSFWCHQDLNSKRASHDQGQVSIDKADLLEVADQYLSHPEVRVNKIDWILLDALVFEELSARVSDTRLYLTLATLISVLKFVCIYLALPTAGYFLFTPEHETLATLGFIGWLLVVLIHLVGAPFRWQDLKRGLALQRQFQDLYAMLGDRSMSPSNLRESLDQASVAGAELDVVVFALVDRMIASDATVFDPEQIGASAPVA